MFCLDDESDVTMLTVIVVSVVLLVKNERCEGLEFLNAWMWKVKESDPIGKWNVYDVPGCHSRQLFFNSCSLYADVVSIWVV